MSEQPYRTSDRRVIPWLLFGLLVLFGGMYAVTYYYTGDRIPRGTTVNGIEVGGMLPASAERMLTVGLGGRAAEPLSVTADGERATIRPASAGFTVDVAATVREARTTPSWDPRRIWDWFAGGEEREPVVTVDSAALDRSVAQFARQVDEPAVEGAVRFARGVATARYPVRGAELDRAAAAAVIRRAFLHDSGPGEIVALPTRVARSTVTADEVSRAMDTFANPATSGPVMVRFNRRDVQVPPAAFTSALSMKAVGSQLRPQVDDKELLRALRPRMKALARAPRGATITVVAGRPKLSPARNGVTFNPKGLSRGFVRALTRTGADRILTVRSVSVPADFTNADARKLRITQRVSMFTTRFPYAAYRNVNLGRAAELLDGTIVRPGQTFSLNRTLGQRTAANGFTRGFVISDGVYTEDFGGGVSQVATTTFNAAFFAGLADVEHKAHSFYISRYPVGREATVAWPDVDLKFENTTPYGVLIQASIERATPSRQGVMQVAMYSTKYWDIKTSTSDRYNPTAPRTRHLTGPGCVPNDGYGGFDIDVHRLFYRHGSSELHHRETMHTKYTPSDTVVCS